MLTYEQMERLAGEVLTTAKQRSGIEKAGLVVRRFYGNELGTVWQPSRPDRNHYPDVDNDGVLIFVGGVDEVGSYPEPRNGHEDYRKKVVYAGLRQTLLTPDQFKQDVANQIRQNATNFPKNESLQKIAQHLE